LYTNRSISNKDVYYKFLVLAMSITLNVANEVIPKREIDMFRNSPRTKVKIHKLVNYYIVLFLKKDILIIFIFLQEGDLYQLLNIA